MAAKEPKSLFRRLTRLFRSGPVVKRKIRTADTAVAVADKTKSSGTMLFQKSLSPTYATITSNAYNLSERLMRYQDYQEMEYCLISTTCIPTVDGMVEIGELARRCSEDPAYTFIIYAYDHERKRIVPALGKQARQTRVDHAWKVTFDNGKSITASENHRLMLRDGSYCEVRDLQPGDAMMPFHRKDLFENAKEGTKGYSWVYTMDERFSGWTKEHQLVAEWVAGRPLADDEVVHHINFVKTDNRPENLRIMTKSDHDSYHAAINNGVKWAPENHEWIKEFKKNHAAWMRDNAPTQRRDVTFARILEMSEALNFDLISVCRALDVDRNVVYSRLADYGFARYETFVQAYRRVGPDGLMGSKRTVTVRELNLKEVFDVIEEQDTKQQLCLKLRCTVNVFNKFLDRKVGITWSALREMLGWKNESTRIGGRPKGSNGNSLTFQQICDAYTPDLTLPRLTEKLGVNKNTVISRLAQNGFKKYSEFQHSYENCKVVSVEYAGEMPLYDLTVDGYKNFATDSVISHNTPEIAAALDIYADETVASDDKGRILHVYSDNEKIKEILEDLFYNTLNVEFNLRSWVRNLPVHKDTVIPLFDGRNITIEQLAKEHVEGKENWVYSVQDGTHGTVPGKVTWCGLTRHDSELVRVWLDDGTYVDCTPDHEWVMRDGSQKKAEDLNEGESLMPFYRKESSKLETPLKWNREVARVERLEQTSDVYCMEVLGPNGEHDRHNFAVVSKGGSDDNGVFVGNCKYGDFFMYNDVSPDYGVVNAFPIPVNEIEREENYDRDDPFAVRYRWVTLGNRTLENWEVSHFRLLGNDMFLPYGASIVEPARRIWRQLILIEDAMLVYRVVRAPERRVFYIDVANIPPENVPMYVEEQRKNLRTNSVVDNQTGRVDLRYNPLSVDEDYFIPVRGAETGTKIDTLAGGQNAAAVEDVAYIQKKLFAALKIPRAYLGYDELLCLPGDTLVPLLSGKVMELHDLVDQFADVTKRDDLWVYSCDPTTGAIVPGKVIDAWKTKDVSELHEVTLDDGTVIRCTDNHPFLCRDGTYVKARDLVVGQSLMPLYRKLSSKRHNDFQNGYEKVQHNGTGDWFYTHRIVNEHGLIADHESRCVERSYVVHHVDHDKRNNLPKNLVKMGKRSHAVYHSQGLTANLLLETSRDRLREVMKTPEYIDAHRAGVVQAWNDDGGARRAQMAANNSKHKRKDVDLAQAAIVARGCSDRKDFYQKIGLTYTGFQRTCQRQGVHHGTWLSEIFGNKRLRIKRNHKVVSIRVVQLDHPQPVYDITVEGFHNFAVKGAGSNDFAGCVIVSNSSKATLAQEDIRFSRTIAVIQKTVLAELNKLAIIHLYAHGYDGEELQNFVLRLSNPSTVAQQQKLELWRAKFEIGASLPEGMGSAHLVQRDIWGMSEEEIELNNRYRLKEKQFNEQVESGGAGASAGGGDSGGADLFGGGEEPEEEPAAETEETPPPETAGEEPEEEVEPDVSLLTSGDAGNDEHFGIKMALKDGDHDRPIKAQNHLKHVMYNRGRRRTHGASKTHMPDFAKMTAADNKSLTDPNDSAFMKSIVSNPFGEATQHRSPSNVGMSPDLVMTLEKMSKSLLGRRISSTPSIIVEDVQNLDEPSDTFDHGEVFTIDDEDE